MLDLADIWNCQNASAFHHNTNFTFPNKILPVADHALSFLSAIINLLLLLTLYVRCKRLGTAPLSSIFCVNICIAHLLESANVILLMKSSEAPLAIGSNIFTFIASGVEDLKHFVRVGFFLPIYLIRLLYVLSPGRFLPLQERRSKLELCYCLLIWVVGIGIASGRTYVRLNIVQASSDELGKIASGLIAVVEIFSAVGGIVSLATTICMARLFFKYRSTEPNQCSATSPDATADRHGYHHGDRQGDRHGDLHGKMVYESIKSGLQILLAFQLTDIVFSIYLNILSVLAIKFYFSPGCWPELFVQIRNYLGTPTNFVYSYHCLDVLHGICVSIIFFLQKPMRQTVRFMLRIAELVVTYWIRKRRERAARKTSY